MSASAGDDELAPHGAAASESVTVLLQGAQAGNSRSLDALFTRVYDELLQVARRVRGGRAGETLNTTALVHEAYIKLVPSADRTWESRAHFFGVAARAMRQVLVSGARKRLTQKRGGGLNVTLSESISPAPVRAEQIVALDEALERLGRIEPRAVSVVEHRFFVGLTTAETASVLRVSTGTVERDWRAARAWLEAELGEVA
jgi:RNA polymerase sigma factor (TIGR02999 family)